MQSPTDARRTWTVPQEADIDLRRRSGLPSPRGTTESSGWRQTGPGHEESFAVLPTTYGFAPSAVIAPPSLHPGESQRTVGGARRTLGRGTTYLSVVEIQRTFEPLKQGDYAGISRLVEKPGLRDPVRGNTSVDDAEHPAHDGTAGSSTWRYSDSALLTLYFPQPQGRLFVAPLDVLIHDGDRCASTFLASCHSVRKCFAHCLFRVVGR